MMMLMVFLCLMSLVAASMSMSQTDRKVTRRLTAESELRYYHYTSNDSENKLGLSEETKRFQIERETKSAKIHISQLERDVLLAHYEPKVDIHVSAPVSRGKLWEGGPVIAMSKHIELILSEFNVTDGDKAMGWKANASQSRLAFIDIGANIGGLFLLHLIAAQDHRTQIHLFLMDIADTVYTVPLGARFLNHLPINIFAFEPSAETMALLSSSLRQNNLSNVYLYPYGLVDSGDIGDTASFVVDEVNKGHNHLKGDQSWSERDGEIVDIETVPLDLFTQILKDRYPAMYSSWTNALWLKMDTEGLEATIIRGGQQSLFSNSEMDPCFIKLEYAKHKEEVYTLLTEAGYEMVHFDWNSIAQSNRIPRAQAIRKPDWDATFAKKDSLECVRRKVDNLKRQWSNEAPAVDDTETQMRGSGARMITILVVMVSLAFWGWVFRLELLRYCPLLTLLRPKKQ